MKMKNCFLALTLIATLMGSVANADLLSEFEPNPEGTDPGMLSIEISGMAGSMFDLTFLTVEAEGTGIGVIDSFASVTGIYGSNGLAVFSVPDFENPAFTALLVTGFTGMLGADLDTDNDGVLDSTPWTSIADSLNVPDAGSIGSGDIFYGTSSVSVPPMGFDDEPISVFRDSVSGAWYSINEVNGTLVYGVFDAAGTQLDPTLFNIDPTITTSTFGSANPTTTTAIPEPSCFLLATLASLVAVRRRR